MINISKCARPDCRTPAKSSCSVCEREHYCSGSCQKLDWKIHKAICPILKKLKYELRPYLEVYLLIEEILGSKKGNDCRVLEHLLSFADDQFGEAVIGKNYRERGDGERFSNWNLDVYILNQIITRLATSYDQDNSLSPYIQVNMLFPHLERSLRLLNPYSDGNNGTDRLDVDQINALLQGLCLTEQSVAAHSINRRQFDAAEGHCERCLAYSRRYGLEDENHYGIGSFRNLLCFTR